MRGKPIPQHPTSGRRGCIPAYAGEALGREYAAGEYEVHPRVCGGSPAPPSAIWRGPGASPRMRGKLFDDDEYSYFSGCIPAYAGEALANASIAERRGCIPAYAGEAMRCQRIRYPRRVHPRVCGGSVCGYSRLASVAGASPRMRGKLRIGDWTEAFGGCIPAYAGEARPPSSAGTSGWVHPRVCGGSDSQGSGTIHCSGASPRMRGKHCSHYATPIGFGCIPAYAGEALRFRSSF